MKKNHTKESGIRVNYEYKSVEIDIEMKDPKIDGNIIDRTLKLTLIQDVKNPRLEGWIYNLKMKDDREINCKIAIPILEKHGYFSKEDIEVPSSVVDISKSQIIKGIDQLLDHFLLR